MDERTDALRAAADAARAVNRGVRTTLADPATLAAATTLLEEAAALLTADVYPGPHAQTGLGPEHPFSEFTSPADFFPYSPVIGPLNPVAPPVEMAVQADGSVRGTVTLTENYNGPPWDLSHGGVVALVFDELLGAAGIAGAGGGFTGRLTVRYHHPTPILRPLQLEARVTHVHGRKITVRGSIHDGETRTAEAEGLFIAVAGPLSEHERTPDPPT